MFLRRADHSSRGVLPSVVCLNVIVKPRKGRPRPEYGPKSHKKVSSYFEYLENRSRGLDVTWQPVGGDLSVWSYDRASRSASFYSSHAGFFGKASHHPGLTDTLQSRFGSLRLPAFPKPKVVFEMDEICECDCPEYIRLVNGVSLPTDWLHGRVTVDVCTVTFPLTGCQVTVHGYTVRSPLTGCQVTSRPRDRFSRYSKWLDTFRTALVCLSATSVPNFIYLFATNSHIQYYHQTKYARFRPLLSTWRQMHHMIFLILWNYRLDIR